MNLLLSITVSFSEGKFLVKNSPHLFLMSQVDPKEEQIRICWCNIRNLSGSLTRTDNDFYKWHTLADCVRWSDLLRMKGDWQASMVAYYIRLTKYEPIVEQKQYYDQLLDAINQLVGLLNN